MNPLFKQTGGDDVYKPLVSLSNIIEQGENNRQPQNAEEMRNGNGEVIRYNQDPSTISKK
jgi:hypothetical protein